MHRTRHGRKKQRMDVAEQLQALVAQNSTMMQQNAQLLSRIQRLEQRMGDNADDINHQAEEGGNGETGERFESAAEEEQERNLDENKNGDEEGKAQEHDDDDEESYESRPGIIGVDGSRMDETMAEDDERDLINNLSRQVNNAAAPSNGDDEEEQDEEEMEEEQEEQQEDASVPNVPHEPEAANDNDHEESNTPPEVFFPDYECYGKLSENDRASTTNCPKLVIALLGVSEGSDEYNRHYMKDRKEAVGVQWGSLLTELYPHYIIGKRSPDDLMENLEDLFVGVWENERSFRRHRALIWRDENGRLQSFDPHKNTSTEPKIVEQKESGRNLSLLKDQVNFLYGVYPAGTAVIGSESESESVVEIIDSSSDGD